MENSTHYVRLCGADLEPICGDRFSPDWTTSADDVTCPDCMEWLAAKAERQRNGEVEISEPAPAEAP